MGSRRNLDDQKWSFKAVDEEEEDEEEEQEEESVSKRMRAVDASFSSSKKFGSTSGGSSAGGWAATAARAATCQADHCTADMSEAKRYHRRHKVCEFHAKAPMVIIAGIRQRFCQQCSRFHELSEFDESKRSCRRRLACHNERRRKSSSDIPGEGSSDREEAGATGDY